MGVRDDRVDELIVVVARHELRLEIVEKLIAAQTAALIKLQTRLTIIGSVLIGVIGVSSEVGGMILRSIFV